MNNSNEKVSESKSPQYVEYVRDRPHPRFTRLQIQYIRSIDDILTPQEVSVISQAESFWLRLEDGDVSCNEIPGLRMGYRNTVIYIQRYADILFPKFMEKVMDHIAGEPQGPEMFLRFVDPVRIMIDDIGMFYPLTYGVDAFQWRDRVRSRMEKVGALTGEFDNGKFVLSDGSVFPVASLRIERSNNPGLGYADDW